MDMAVYGARIDENDHHCIGLRIDERAAVIEPETACYFAAALIRMAVRAVDINGTLGKGNPTWRDGIVRCGRKFAEGWRGGKTAPFSKSGG